MIIFNNIKKSCGHFGFEQGRSEVHSFTLISSLSGHEVKAAYTRCNHSFFEMHEGKILSCRSNHSGQLLLSGGTRDDSVYY